MSTAMLEAPTSTSTGTSRLDQLCAERVDGALSLASTRFSGFPLPWLNLQRYTDTFLPGDLVLAVAYTGTGKTTFVQNLLEHWAKLGIPSLLFPTEQLPPAMVLKQACLMAQIPLMDARRDRLDAAWKARLEAAIRAQGQAPYNLVNYYPSPSPTTTEVLSAIRAATKKGIRIHVIDYLGRMDYSDIKAASEWQQVKVFIRDLKNLAVELNILILACAQIMSKGDENAIVSHKPPLLSAIQGGQAIAMEADIVLGLYQPIKETATEAELKRAKRSVKAADAILEKSTAAVVVLKHREDGSRRNKQALFWVKHNRFIMRNPQDAVMPEGLEQSDYERDMGQKALTMAGVNAEFESIERTKGQSGSGDAFDH